MRRTRGAPAGRSNAGYAAGMTTRPGSTDAFPLVRLDIAAHGAAVGVRLPDGHPARAGATSDGVLPVRSILGIGRNYAEHAKEQKADVPDRPLVFAKTPAAACLAGDDIVIPRACTDPACGEGAQIDYEGELAVILAAPCRDVPIERALDPSLVLGYCCANDVSARWWQRHGAGGQFNRGKSFDTFCPLGPHVTRAESVPDPQALRIRTTVSGELVQDDTTGAMLFPVAQLIAELSRDTTLVPGTVILTGTPSGVGAARTPPRFLGPGDEVEVEIEGLGALRNAVRAAD
jgi:2-keto-4-pentenoate hydratase/2-oxohepta-3-ene-1,7-dioic acid hydratase in catechol pathway